MRFYQEIILRKTPEISSYFIWSKLYTQLHLALVEQQNPDKAVNFGVSFPEYRYGEKGIGLGAKLRIFAQTETALQQLNLATWLERLMDYVQIESVKAVPNKVTAYSVYQRIRVKSSKERVARRRARKKDVSLEQALSELENFQARQTDLPFIQMNSLSTKQAYKLFIRKTVSDTVHQGSFTVYGLSKESTVPEF